MFSGKTLLRLSMRAMALLLPLLFCVNAVTVHATATATTTTLTTGSKTVNSHTITTLTAKVAATGTTTAVTQGLVRFYDGKLLLGTSQIVYSGTKYTHGAAYFSAELGAGTHSITAAFAGTATYASSTSAAASVVIAGGTTSTTLSSTGTAGNYTLSSHVVGNGPAAPTGTVSFVDQTSSNAVIGSATLGTATLASKIATQVTYPIFDTADGAAGAQMVAVADFNGDGLLDLADVDWSGPVALSIHMGKGDGTFMAAAPPCWDTTTSPATPCFAGSSEPYSLAVGDFNQDGIPDIVITDNNDSDVSVLLGKGDGTFQPYKTVNTNGNGAGYVVVGDFNRDGKPDLAVAAGDYLSIILGNGDGTFSTTPTLISVPSSPGSSPQYLAIGHFHSANDGIQDLAVVCWDSNLYVLLGNGNGTFKAPTATTTTNINSTGALVIADFNGDGKDDVAFVIPYAGAEVLLGNGDGSFASNPWTYATPGSVQSTAVAVGDFNADGKLDLALANSFSGPGNVTVFYGKGDGTFSNSTAPLVLAAGYRPWWLSVGDFDGNGVPDLVAANQGDSATASTNTLSVLLASATSTAAATLANVSAPGTGTQSVVAKYAGDTHYSTSTSSAITLTGTGGITGPPVISSLSPSTVANGSGAFTLTVNGSSFATGAIVQWGGSARTTAFVSATKLTAAISAADVATPGPYSVTVTVGTQVSNTATFTVTQSSTGPTTTALTPNYATINSPATTVTVTGTNFISGSSVVHFGTTALTTAYVSATKLTAVIPAANLTTLGTFQVTVWNGGVSASIPMPFTVGPATHLPLAYGFFNKDGSAGATSGNITCTWSTTDLDYQCTITGESFIYNKYVVNATVGDINTVGIITANSIQNKVAVRIYKVDGTTRIQAPFYLTVFKP
jgi:hypothetical protein